MSIQEKKLGVFEGSDDLEKVSKKTLLTRLALYGLSSAISIYALSFVAQKAFGEGNRGIESKLQIPISDHKNKTQYALARNARGCKILVRYDFLNKSGSQYTLQTEILPKNYQSCHN